MTDKIIRRIGGALVALVLLFPPWVIPETGASVGRHLVWSEPTTEWTRDSQGSNRFRRLLTEGPSRRIAAKVAVGQLVVEVGGILGLSLLLTLGVRRAEPGRPSNGS